MVVLLLSPLIEHGAPKGVLSSEPVARPLVSPDHRQFNCRIVVHFFPNSNTIMALKLSFGNRQTIRSP